jgi:hypothetical protein
MYVNEGINLIYTFLTFEQQYRCLSYSLVTFSSPIRRNKLMWPDGVYSVTSSVSVRHVCRLFFKTKKRVDCN